MPLKVGGALPELTNNCNSKTTGIMMATTLRDIADRCGVAISTVSRALRDDELVTIKTRQRIAEIARTMGYSPNLAARTLVGSRTNTIWFLVSDMTNKYQQTIAEHTSRFFADNGYDVSVVSYHGSWERFAQLLRRLNHGVTDGAIVVSAAKQGEEELNVLERKGFPLVFADRKLESATQPTVTTDNVAGTTHLLELMCENGAEKFVILFTDQNSVERTRFRSAVEYLGQKGIPFTFGDNFSPEFAAGNKKIGILATWPHKIEDFVAQHSSHGRPPYLYGVFDSWHGEPYPASRVFVCKQNFKAIAEKSAQLLLEMLNGGVVTETLHLIPPEEYETICSRIASVF